MKRCPKCCSKKHEKEFYCSKRGKPYHGWCKLCLNHSQKERWKARKAKAVEIMGGKCNGCGYARNLAAFEFHHLDPSSKEFAWNRLSKRPWEEVVTELKKCILLCANCHREIHNPDCSTDRQYGLANSNFDKERVKIVAPTGTCKRKECSKEVYGTLYCSSQCASLEQRKVKRPSSNTLAKEMSELNWSELGRKYGVSDNAVRKWAKQYRLI